jgi:outer membrane protein TolC
MKPFPFLLLAAFSYTFPAAASERFEFKEIWSRMRSESSEIRASDAELRSARSAEDRSARHWIPGLSLNGRGIHTNDPSQIFFSRLGQRSVEAGDFVPSILNHPGTANFLSSSLGLQWSLFEGGGAVAYRDLQSSTAQMKALSRNLTEWDIYVDAVSSYATILNAESLRQSVGGLEATVQQVLSRYTVGSKSNPVGYSGLLGLKSLVNRLQAVEDQVRIEADRARARIRTQASSVPADFQVRSEPVSVFLGIALPDEDLDSTESLPVSLAEKRVELSRAAIGIDRARSLPQVGVFGEGGMVNGARSTGAAYSGGLYLRWNLFDPRDLGSLTEKRLEQEAALARLEGVKASIRTGRESGLNALTVLKSNEKRLRESLELMREQAEVASRLFQSGSINALQLAEVFNRRLELLLSHQQLEREQIETRATLARLASGKGMQL